MSRNGEVTERSLRGAASKNRGTIAAQLWKNSTSLRQWGTALSRKARGGVYSLRI